MIELQLAFRVIDQIIDSSQIVTTDFNFLTLTLYYSFDLSFSSGPTQLKLHLPHSAATC